MTIVYEAKGGLLFSKSINSIITSLSHNYQGVINHPHDAIPLRGVCRVLIVLFPFQLAGLLEVFILEFHFYLV